MKVKELIKKLSDLDMEKEIFICVDGNYLQEDNTFFRDVYNIEDFEFNKGYFLKTEDNLSFVEELGRYGTVMDIKEDIDIAKKYMKNEGYEDIVDEGECYFLE